MVFPRRLVPLLAFALACASCGDDSKGADSTLPEVGEGEGEGEIIPPGVGEGEGEGEIIPPGVGEGEGEGEGPGEGEGELPPPRELEVICGSAPSRVVQPDPLVITASIELPADVCGAHLQRFGSARDPREIRVIAFQTVNARECAGVPQVIEATLTLRNLEPGEWTVTMIGKGPTVFRKTVSIETEGAEPAEPEPACAGGVAGFVGTCGEEVTCQVPTPALPIGYLCEAGTCRQAPPQPLAGEYPVRFEGVDKACQLDPAPPEGCVEEPPEGQEGLLDNPIELGEGTLTIGQDENDASVGWAEFSGETFLANWSGPRRIEGIVAGSTFMGRESTFREPGGGNCTSVHFLQLPAVTKYGDVLIGNVGVVNLELNCGRGCLACELAGGVNSP